MSHPQIQTPEPPFEIWKDYTPVSHQEEFHHSPLRFRLMKGGYGSGKSFACCKEVMKLATEQGGNRLLVGRKHLRVLKDTTLNTFWAAMDPVRSDWLVNWSATRHLLTVRSQDGGTSQIQFLDLEDPQKLRSLEIGAFFVDEASEISEDTFLTLISRTRLKGIRQRCGILATNPTTQEHWLYKRFVEQKLPDYGVFTSTAYDNPHLDPVVLQNMEASFDPERRKRFIQGEWGFCAQGDPVFPSFQRKHHVEDHPVQADQPLALGWDFGFRRPAAVLGQVQGGTLFIADALLGKDQSLDSFADRVMRRVQELTPNVPARHFGDIAGNSRNQVTAESCFARLRARGIPIQGKAQSIDEGLVVIRARLEQLREKRFALTFSHTCYPVMLEAMEGGYHYGNSRNASQELIPIKDGLYDHLVDALRYLVTGLYGNSGLGEDSSATATASWLDDRALTQKWW